MQQAKCMHCIIPYLLEFMTRFFPLNLVQNMCGLKFVYKAPNQTAANRITLNWTMRSQTKTYIIKLSREIHGFVGYYTARSGTSFQMFQNLSIPASRIKKSKRKNWAQRKLTDTIFFGGDFVHHLISWRCTMFWNLALFLFSDKAPNLVHPLDWAILSHWVPQKQ
jgi:hypothetical protein